MVSAVRRYSFTIDEFAKMGDVGIFTEDDRVELIDGEIRELPSISPLHAATVNRLNVTLFESPGRAVVYSVQNPLQLDLHNEFLPDICLIKERGKYYETALPGPGDTLLAIEVADSSLAYDLYEKAPLYAKSMIPELWIVDLEAKVVRVFTQPGPSGYASEREMPRGSTIESAGVEGLSVEVDEIFG